MKTLSIVTSCAIGFVALVIMLFQSSTLGTWYIDDAGISFSYAKTLVQTGILTAQPGALPVEGFSNPLWVFLQALIFLFIEPNIEVTRILACFLIILLYIRINLACKSNRQLRLEVNILLLFLSLQPSVVIWVFSGLENSLYLVAGVELMICLCRAASRTATLQDAFFAAVASSVLVLTRPDGIVYVPTFTIISYLSRVKPRRSSVATALLIPLFVALSYLVFRIYYFHAWFPNTYFAKGLPTLPKLLNIISLDDGTLILLGELLESLFFSMHIWCCLGVLFCLSVVVRRKLWDGVCSGAAMMLAVSLVVYLFMPFDWAPELRFATLVFPAFYLLLIHSFYLLFKHKALYLLIPLLITSVISSKERMNYFLLNPPISTAEVEQRGAYFTRWGGYLGFERPTILIADVGGILIQDSLFVIDLGMLTNKEIAASLGSLNAPPDHEAFHHYIFADKKPVFISTRAYHAWLADLDGSTTFRTDYMPIREYVDTWVLKRYGEVVYAGDYVRRDVVDANPEILAAMRKEADQIYYPFSDKRL